MQPSLHVLPQYILDPRPQLRGKLHLFRSDASLLQEKQRLGDAFRNHVTPEHGSAEPDGVMEPVVDQIKQVLGDVFPVGAMEGRFVRVVHRFEDGVDGLVRNAQIEEQVHHPCRRSHAPLVLQCIALEHWQQDGDRENGLGQPQSATQAPHLVDHSFVGKRLTLLDRLVVQVLQQMLPRRPNICRIPVVGQVEDL